MPVGYPKVINARSKKNRKSGVATRTQKTLLPLVAVGGSLAVMPASALELGEMTVQSRLGQPLRASIAFALGQNEQLANSCITLATGASSSGLPGVGRATISIGDGVIVLNGQTPIREPMVAARVAIDCAYTANLSREYMLFIDPPAPIVISQPAVEPIAVAPAAAQSTPPVVATRRVTTTRQVSQSPIGKSTRYRVEIGDTLGDIASRIENRSIGLWSAVDNIFQANPEAFVDNDPNKLKAGSWLTIPSFDSNAPVVASAAPEVRSYAERASQNAITEQAQTSQNSPTAVAETVSDASADLSPGNVVVDNGNPFVDAGETSGETVVIPDTEIEGPATISSTPNVPTATITTINQESSTPWLTWLAGSGLVMIIGLLLFGRRFRNRHDAPTMAPLADNPARRATDGDGDIAAAAAPLSYDLEDDSPTEENLTLDADLVIGTGLEQGSDMDVAQDFGFASPTEVDIELPFEPEAEVPSTRSGDDTILESEILPDDEDYDLSVIIDATKMPQPEDITERDLRAIEVPAADESAATDSYTINKEVDFNILEQDYEDELTATQALNVEIARAAQELSQSVDGSADDDATAGMPLASVTELDITAQMPSRDEPADEQPEKDSLAETSTVLMTPEDSTVEMPSADNDDPKDDLDVEGGKVDTKAV